MQLALPVCGECGGPVRGISRRDLAAAEPERLWFCQATCFRKHRDHLNRVYDRVHRQVCDQNHTAQTQARTQASRRNLRKARATLRKAPSEALRRPQTAEKGFRLAQEPPRG